MNADLADPAKVLKHTMFGRDVKATYNTGTISKVVTGKSTAEVVSPDNGGWSVRFSDSKGSEFVKWHSVYDSGSNTFRVSEYRGGSLIRSTEYSEDGSGNIILKRYDGNNAPLQEESLVKTDAGDLQTRVRTVKENGSAVSKVSSVYKKFSWGLALKSETADPDHAALTTTYEYYEDETHPEYLGRLKTRADADGSQVSYVYDALGRVITESHTWLNTAGGRVVSYDYTPLPGDTGRPEDVRLPRTVTEKTLNVPTSETRYIYSDNGQGRTEITEQSTGTGSLKTVRTYHPQSRRFESGRLKEASYPDGRKDTVSYENISGSEIKEIVTHTVNGEIIPGISTRDITVSDQFGRTKSSLSEAKVGETWQTLNRTEFVTDDRGRVLEEKHSDGTQVKQVWGCCNLESRTDASGITTSYIYDGLNRIVKEIRERKIGEQEMPIVTEYGRTVSAGTDPDRLSLSSSSQYDTAGRIVSSTDEAEITTTYIYENNGLKTTVKRPGTLPQITERHPDGKTKSVKVGSLETTYTYEPNITTVTTGTSWEKTYTDMAGRTVKTERPGSGGGKLVTENFYDDKGRLTKTTVPGQAPVLYSYDDRKGEQISAADIDNNGVITYGTDRVSGTKTGFVYTDGAPRQSASQFVYDENGTRITVGTSETRVGITGISGEYGLLTAETSATDIHGNVTVRRTYVNPTGKTQTTVTKYPDSDIAEKTVTSYGLPQSSLTKTGVEYRFAYDALGRRTGVEDPRTGISRTYYDSRGRIDYIQDAAGNKTTYAYDSVTGRKSSEKNAQDKFTNYAYTERGQVKEIGGDVPYPVRYEYDDYGRLKKMKTFRDDTLTAPDTTEWMYEEATGLLTAKIYADGKQTGYAYTPEGKLKKRTWARQGGSVFTDYEYYPATGELKKTDYSDATPDISFGYDFLGRPKKITDAVGTHTFAYNAKLQPESETVTGIYDHVITRKYDVKGRSAGFVLGNPVTPDYSVTYGYDSTGRFGSLDYTAAQKTGIVNYSYLPKSDLVQSVQDGAFRTEYGYENKRNLKTTVKNTYAPPPENPVTVSQYDYKYDELGRRTSVVNKGNAFGQGQSPFFNKYGYNDRSELTESKRYQGTVPVDPETRLYVYDPIGNRKTATEDTAVTSYISNNLNQYTALSGAKSATPVHDDDGNVTGYKNLKYSLNAENQMVAAEPKNPAEGDRKTEYLYDYSISRLFKQHIRNV